MDKPLPSPDPNDRHDAELLRAVAHIEARRRAAGGQTSGPPAAPAATAALPAAAVPPGAVPAVAVSRETEQAQREIERLRTLRAWRGRDLSIAGLVGKMRKEADGVQRRLGAIITLWQSAVPPELAACTELTAVRGGVLHVKAESSAVAFEIDRRLREGLLAQLRAGYRGTLTRVKVTVGAPAPVRRTTD